MVTHGRLEPQEVMNRDPGFTYCLLECVPDAIVACDADGRLTVLNPAARDLFGEDLVGMSLDEWANQGDRYCDDGRTLLSTEQVPLVRAFQGEKLTGESVVIVAPGKPPRFFMVSGGPIRDAQGRKLGAVVVMSDAIRLQRAAERASELDETNRKLRAQLEEEHNEKERAGKERALLRCILDSAEDLIFIKDQNSVYRGCNRASEQFLGIPESEQIGQTDDDFFDAKTAELIRATDRRVMETGKPARTEEWVTYADGHKALMDTMKVPYHGPEGELLGLVGIARDITERVRAEEALKESEAKYMDLYEYAPDMYASVNVKTALIEECNTTLANTLGYAKEEIIGQPVFGIYHSDYLEEARKAFQIFVETGEIHDKELQLKKKTVQNWMSV